MFNIFHLPRTERKYSTLLNIKASHFTEAGRVSRSGQFTLSKTFPRQFPDTWLLNLAFPLARGSCRMIPKSARIPNPQLSFSSGHQWGLGQAKVNLDSLPFFLRSHKCFCFNTFIGFLYIIRVIVTGKWFCAFPLTRFFSKGKLLGRMRVSCASTHRGTQRTSTNLYIQRQHWNLFCSPTEALLHSKPFQGVL